MARLNDTELHMIQLANQLDAIEPAARAMLAALKLVKEQLKPIMTRADRDVYLEVVAAIAQAEAAAIKVIS